MSEQNVPTNTAESLIDQSVFDDQVEDQEPSPTVPTVVMQAEGSEGQQSDSLTESVEPTVSYTATPDLRLPPEQWQQWPVVPDISPNAVAIYQHGIARGNNPHRFSKIGDCQSIKEVLLGIYDLPARYTLSPENEYLQAIIDNYSGSFNRDGMAVRGGFNAATVLSPIWSDPEFCDPGENPIQCEYRVHKPTMAIISLEVWWDGRSPERYEQYMRKIIEYSIEQGVVPILSTKADNVEGNHSINYTTAKLAYEYDIPLWNFWSAVQVLPHQGIDPDRDGFHISVAAWNVRSFTALQTIYAVHQAVKESETDNGVEEDTDVVDISETSLPVSELVFGVSDIESFEQPGTLYFELTETVDGEVRPAGIYSLDFVSGKLYRLYPSGTHIVSSNPKYGFLIAAEDRYELIKRDGSKKSIIGFPELTNGKVFLIGEQEFVLTESVEGSGTVFYHGILESSGSLEISKFIPPGIEGDISGAYAATKDLLVVSVGDCEQRECRMYSIENFLAPGSMNVIEMVFFSKPVIQDKTGMMAFWRKINGIDSLNLIDLKNRGNEQFLGLYGNVFLDQAWRNDSNLIAAIKMERSDYYGRATEILHYVVDGETNILKEYSSVIGLNPHIAWSSDGQYLLTSFTQVDDAGNSTIVLRSINMLTGQEIYLDNDLGLTSDTYIAIIELIWLD